MLALARPWIRHAVRGGCRIESHALHGQAQHAEAGPMVHEPQPGPSQPTRLAAAAAAGGTKGKGRMESHRQSAVRKPILPRIRKVRRGTMPTSRDVLAHTDKPVGPNHSMAGERDIPASNLDQWIADVTRIHKTQVKRCRLRPCTGPDKQGKAKGTPETVRCRRELDTTMAFKIGTELDVQDAPYVLATASQFQANLQLYGQRRTLNHLRGKFESYLLHHLRLSAEPQGSNSIYGIRLSDDFKKAMAAYMHLIRLLVDQGRYAEVWARRRYIQLAWMIYGRQPSLFAARLQPGMVLLAAIKGKPKSKGKGGMDELPNAYSQQRPITRLYEMWAEVERQELPIHGRWAQIAHKVIDSELLDLQRGSHNGSLVLDSVDVQRCTNMALAISQRIKETSTSDDDARIDVPQSAVTVNLSATNALRTGARWLSGDTEKDKASISHMDLLDTIDKTSSDMAFEQGAEVSRRWGKAEDQTQATMPSDEGAQRLALIRGLSTSYALRLLRRCPADGIVFLQKCLDVLEHMPSNLKDTLQQRRAYHAARQEIRQMFVITQRYMLATLPQLKANPKSRTMDQAAISAPSTRQLIDLAIRSLQLGVWDMARDEKAAIRSFSLSTCAGPAFDYARFWLAAIVNVIPAGRTGRGMAGRLYWTHERIGKEQECLVQVTQMLEAMAETIKEVRRRALHLTNVHPQPWHLAFGQVMDNRRFDVHMMVTALTVQWSHQTLRSSAKTMTKDPQLANVVQRDAEAFADRIQMLVDDILAPCHAGPRSWLAAHMALKQVVNYVPSPEARLRARQYFAEAYERRKDYLMRSRLKRRKQGIVVGQREDRISDGRHHRRSRIHRRTPPRKPGRAIVHRMERKHMATNAPPSEDRLAAFSNLP